MLDRCPDGGQDLVGQLLPACERPVPGGLVADDDCGVGLGIAVVESNESQVGDDSEANRPQLLRELVVAAGGDLRGSPGPGRGDQSSRPFSSVSAIASRP